MGALGGGASKAKTQENHGEKNVARGEGERRMGAALVVMKEVAETVRPSLLLAKRDVMM